MVDYGYEWHCKTYRPRDTDADTQTVKTSITYWSQVWCKRCREHVWWWYIELFQNKNGGSSHLIVHSTTPQGAQLHYYTPGVERINHQHQTIQDSACWHDGDEQTMVHVTIAGRRRKKKKTWNEWMKNDVKPVDVQHHLWFVTPYVFRLLHFRALYPESVRSGDTTQP